MHVRLEAHPDTEKAKQIVLQIIRESGGGFEGLTRLYKAYYIAHLFHWQNHQGVLSTYPIVRMPQGPGIDDGASIIRELEEAGRIRSSVRMNGPYRENLYSLVEQNEGSGLDPGEIESVRAAVLWTSGRSAAEVSELTHEHSRTWQRAKNGERLDIYLDLLSDEEYETRQRELSATKELMDGAFS